VNGQGSSKGGRGTSAPRGVSVEQTQYHTNDGLDKQTADTRNLSHVKSAVDERHDMNNNDKQCTECNEPLIFPLATMSCLTNKHIKLNRNRPTELTEYSQQTNQQRITYNTPRL